MTAPVYVIRKRFGDRAHFDGVLASCAGIAVMIAAIYGVLYMVLGGDPIHILCEAAHRAFVQDTSLLGTEMLRTMWQTKQVFSYKLICQNTVEEKILHLQNMKKGVADAIIPGQDTFKTLTREDLEMLFEV